jgi:multidrug efflux pump
MAVAIMGGLLIATMLTLIFLPALYVLIFDRRGPSAKSAEPLPADA